MKTYTNYISENKKRFVNELSDYIGLKSVSSDPKAKGDIVETANWLSQKMEKAQLENIKIMKTKGNPIVYADWLHQKDKPTVLFYGHYDVMPAGDSSKWKTKPFKMEERKGILFGRGVADNKGPHLSIISGIETMLQTKGELPVNVKFLIEGEEEIGSVNIKSSLEKNRETYESDVALVADGQKEFDYPVVEYGLRGLVYLELEVKCLEKNVHSGSFGGVVDNPVLVLAWLISKMKDRKGRITIPSFYEDVRKISQNEKKLLSEVEIEDKQIKENTGALKVFGEDGFLNIERIGARPTFDVNGIKSGYTEEGAMTIIPASAIAKISLRLVPDQKAEKVEQLVRNFIKKLSPDTCEVEVKLHHGGDPIVFDWKSDKFRACVQALTEVFEKKARYKLVGGSIGAVAYLQKVLGVDSILTGFSLPDSNMHGPNENMPLKNFIKGIEFVIKYLEKTAELSDTTKLNNKK